MVRTLHPPPPKITCSMGFYRNKHPPPPPPPPPPPKIKKKDSYPASSQTQRGLVQLFSGISNVRRGNTYETFSLHQQNSIHDREMGNYLFLTDVRIQMGIGGPDPPPPKKKIIIITSSLGFVGNKHLPPPPPHPRKKQNKKKTVVRHVNDCAGRDFQKTQSVIGKWTITYFLPMRGSREGYVVRTPPPPPPPPKNHKLYRFCYIS